MRVLYDYQAFLQRQGGIPRYFVELIGALEEIGVDARLPKLFSDSEYLEYGMTFLTRRHFKGKEKILNALNRIRAARALKGDFDLFHPTYYSPYFLKALKRPFVITVHDMIHELFPSDYIRDDGTARNKRIVCEKASRIIAVSTNTKNDLCRLLNVPEAKVTVIPHATSLRYDGGPRVFERPYILYVGARSGYKNFATMLEAAATILPRHGVDLVCAGGETSHAKRRRPFARMGSPVASLISHRLRLSSCRACTISLPCSATRLSTRGSASRSWKHSPAGAPLPPAQRLPSPRWRAKQPSTSSPCPPTRSGSRSRESLPINLTQGSYHRPEHLD